MIWFMVGAVVTGLWIIYGNVQSNRDKVITAAQDLHSARLSLLEQASALISTSVKDFHEKKATCLAASNVLSEDWMWAPLWLVVWKSDQQFLDWMSKHPTSDPYQQSLYHFLNRRQHMERTISEYNRSCPSFLSKFMKHQKIMLGAQQTSRTTP